MRGVRSSVQVGRMSSAFSVVEIMVAISISTIFFTAAALVYQNVTANSRRLATLETVELGAGMVENFYALTDTDSIRVYSAPNYGRSAFTAELAEIFREDVWSASAVYCLGRQEGELNQIRPLDIDAPADGELMDTPEKFRQHLLTEYPDEADVFVEYSGASTAVNASIYLVGRSADPSLIRINVVYDIDIVAYPADEPDSNYVSVRRYVSGQLTNYYDALFEIGDGSDFSPLMVEFPRRNRSLADSSDWNLSYEHPFYLVWWPDPAAHYLESDAVSTTGLSSPLDSYYQMGGRTGFMFAVPFFPAQL